MKHKEVRPQVSMARLVIASCLAIAAAPVTAEVTAEVAAEPSLQYLPFDAPAGMSQAVVVQGFPLVHTRQLLPLDSAGQLVGEDSADRQIEQVLDNLDSVLDAAGSGRDKLVRLNVYALSHQTVHRVRELLSKRLDPAVRPAITAVLTPLPHRKARVAVDAVAVATEQGGQSVALQRCEAVAGDQEWADVAVLPRGGVVYLSGQPEQGGLAVSAVTKSLSTLLQTLEQLKLSPAHVVQLKVFLTPASSADEVLPELKKLFPNQLAPPVVFVEWIASVPVEIELIAQLPRTDDPAERIEFHNPPEVIPSPTFSRAALVRSDRKIYISSLSARHDGDDEAQGREMFAQLKVILAETGSDLRHLAKATYYVSSDEASGVLNKLRPQLFDPERPPAASKVTVHATGQADRTLSMDMIAVGAPSP